MGDSLLATVDSSVGAMLLCEPVSHFVGYPMTREEVAERLQRGLEPVADGSWVILATDGLTDFVDDVDDSLRGATAGAPDASTVVERLITAAFAGGAGDNVAVAALHAASAQRGENALASVEQFQDDERGYRRWIEANPNGYVINILRGLSPSTARVHRADCWTIDPRRPGPWTGQYVKLCSPQLEELDHWATERNRTPIARCGTCRPDARMHIPLARTTLRPTTATTPSQITAPRPRLRQAPDRSSASEIHGPFPRSPIVEAWIDHYIRFEHRPVEEEELRDEIRARVRRLKPNAGEVLHATLLGAKHPAADVENLALYYIDDSGGVFASAARFGLRFELGAQAPSSPSGMDYSYGYRYELAPRGAGVPALVTGTPTRRVGLA
jgi:hypothetical protein